MHPIITNICLWFSVRLSITIMHGIHYVPHSQAMLELGVCEIAHFLFMFISLKFILILYLFLFIFLCFRDHPDTIKRRFVSVSVICVIIPILLQCFGTTSNAESVSLQENEKLNATSKKFQRGMYNYNRAFMIQNVFIKIHDIYHDTSLYRYKLYMYQYSIILCLNLLILLLYKKVLIKLWHCMFLHLLCHTKRRLCTCINSSLWIWIETLCCSCIYRIVHCSWW